MCDKYMYRQCQVTDCVHHGGPSILDLYYVTIGTVLAVLWTERIPMALCVLVIWLCLSTLAGIRFAAHVIGHDIRWMHCIHRLIEHINEASRRFSRAS